MTTSSQRTGLALTVTIALLFMVSCAGGQTATRESEPTPTVPGVEEIELNSLEEVQQRAPISGRFHNIVIRRFESKDPFRRDYPDAAMQCATALVSHLKSKAAYRTVTDDKSAELGGKTLLADFQIVDMRITSGAARFWGGAFAGASFMKVLVRLTDGGTGQVVHEKVLSSTVSAFGAAWTMGASDQSLPIDFGKLLGEYLYTIVPSAA